MSDPFPAVPALGLQAELLLHRFLECDISTDTISVSFSRWVFVCMIAWHFYKVYMQWMQCRGCLWWQTLMPLLCCCRLWFSGRLNWQEMTDLSKWAGALGYSGYLRFEIKSHVLNMAENQPSALQAVPIDPNAGSACFRSRYSRFPSFAHMSKSER